MRETSGSALSASVRVPAAVVRSMVEHAENDRPREACGLLIGRDGIELARPMGNIARDLDEFLFDPEQQLAVWHEAERSGRRVLGIYHSHPTAPAMPSPADEVCISRHPSLIHIIVSGSRVRAYCWDDGAIEMRLS